MAETKKKYASWNELIGAKLSLSHIVKFGVRIPFNVFERLNVLDSEDCWVTWLVKQKDSKELLSLKQFAKQDGQIERRLLKELWFYHLVFEKTEYDYNDQFTPVDGGPKVSNEGIQYILRLHNYVDTV
jgi:hypothetical protein